MQGMSELLLVDDRSAVTDGGDVVPRDDIEEYSDAGLESDSYDYYNDDISHIATSSLAVERRAEGDTLAVQSIEELQVHARTAVDAYDEYCEALDHDSQPSFRLQQVQEPSPLMYALSRVEPWKRQFHKAAKAGLFFWTRAQMDRLSKRERRLLDRMLYPTLAKMAESKQDMVLRGHPGDEIIGSSIDSLYRRPDGTMPSTEERERYADDLKVLQSYAGRRYVELYGNRAVGEIREPLEPGDLDIVLRQGELRVFRAEKER